LPREEIGKLAKEFTVLIDSQSPGSGVIIGRNDDNYYVLTVWHAVQYADWQYKIVTTDQQKYDLDYRRVRRLSPSLDLAIIQFTSKNTYSIAKVGNSDQVAEGMPVYISGFPNPGLGIQDRIYRFIEGSINGIYPKPLEGGYTLLYSNNTRAGFSGGPVMDTNANVIGIHGKGEVTEGSSTQSGNDNISKTGYNIGIPINSFLSLLPIPGIDLEPSVGNTNPSPQDARPTSVPSPVNPTDYLPNPSLSPNGVLKPKIPSSTICPAGPGRC
jgi:S1-C subfamily serine protease